MAKPKRRPKKQSPTSKVEDKPLPDCFTCPFCDKTFKKQGSLTRHVHMHDEFKKIAFDNNATADNNTTAEKFPCSECSKVFAKKHNLISHMKTHPVISCSNDEDSSYDEIVNFEDNEEDLFPYECPECLECFSEERFLTAHSKNHDMARIYNCKICDSTFSHRRALNRHILTHTGSKQFKCNFCNATFNDVSSRTKHARKHIVWCGVCNCSFKSLDEFRTHVINYHKKKSPNALKLRESISDDSLASSDDERTVESRAESSDSDQAYEARNKNTQKTVKSDFEDDAFKKQKVSSGNVCHNLKDKNPSDCLVCPECNVQFRSTSALQKHSMNCSLLRYVCSSPNCNNMVFNTKASFLQHMKLKHQSSPTIKKQNPATKGNRNENEKDGPMLTSSAMPFSEHVLSPNVSYIIPNPNAGGNINEASGSTNANESIYVTKRAEMYPFGSNVVSNIVQPHIINQTMLMDPLLLATGFVPQHVDPTTAYIDFNIESYIPWFKKFLDLIKSCEYPLQYELFERISHCLKVISNIIGRPFTKMNEQQNFALLLKFHEEFSKISEKHLKHIAKDIFK